VEERQRVHTGAVQLMQQTTAATNEASSIEDALQACIDLICDYIQWPLGHAWLRVKGDKNRLEPTNIWHMDDPDKYAPFRQETEFTTFVSGKGLPGRVLASGKSEWIPDLGIGTIFMRAKIASHIGVTSGFALPLLVNQDVVGVLEFFTEEMTDVDDSLMDLIPYLGTQIGRIVERIWAQEELIAAKEAAETANIAKTAFLSSISHELRTPLNSIIGFGELLSSDPENPLTEDQDDSITHITGSGKQLLDLIDVILELSNIESGDIELVLQDFPVMGLIEETLDQVTDLAASRNIVISADCKVVQAPIVVADYARLSQVLTTILLNAVTHNKENGEVTIEVSPADQDRLKISVTDTGDGIAETRQGKLFQPFANLETGQDAAGGTGFGLAIACGLMSLMNGTIGLHSEEGKGSTFWIDLPLASTDDTV
jgi:signal transduction histidine kinase